MKALIIGAGDDVPFELIEYIFCSEVYHCTPSQLRQERAVDLLRHMLIRKWVIKADKRKQQPVGARS